jgi:RES domain-containing protein
LYLALHEITAINEFCQGLGQRLHDPIMFVSYAVDCEDVEDLTSAATRTRLHVDLAALNCGWQLLASTGRRVPSWEVAERLRRTAAGIIVPSFAHGASADCKNLVLWRWSDALPYQVKVFDPKGGLPRDASAWRR